MTMGWWKIEGTEHVVGDGPLDTLGAAVREVVGAYEAAFKRRPSRAEWEALLLGALGAEEPRARSLDEGVVTGVHLDSKP
jgi:hypothetical protein